MTTLEVNALSKYYGSARGIEDVSFAIDRGEVFGYLGPNGSGKTTTLRCIMGLFRPNQGEVRVLGQRVEPHRATQHARMGYLPGEFRTWRAHSSERTLGMLAALGGGSGVSSRRRQLADRLELDLKKPIGLLSKGNRQKVGVIYAFQHQPAVLILDEPTSGLDPLIRQVVLDLIREAAQNGATVLLSSHDLGEVAAVCGRAAILREGRLAEVASIATLVQQEEHHLKIWFAEAGFAPALPSELQEQVRIVQRRAGFLHLAYRGACAGVLRWLAQHPVDRLETPHTSLEEAFLGYYSGSPSANRATGLHRTTGPKETP